MLHYLLTHSPLFYLIQPFWRDEAFSALLAMRPLTTILQQSAFEPPLYYILLHFWIQIFGSSEIAIRSLSFLGWFVGAVAMVFLGEYLYGRRKQAMLIPLFYVLNPFLLYYAFEARAYGWFMAFASLSILGYVTKRWKLFMIGTTLGVYTHLYMVFVPFVMFVHTCLTTTLLKKITLKRFVQEPLVRALIIIGVVVSPWFIRFLSYAGKFKDSWYYPVDWHLISSVLGNMFLNYEGTPWYMWEYTTYLTIFFLVISAVALLAKSIRTQTIFFLLLMYLPLIIILGISQFKPLFVNRYLLPVSLAESIILAIAILAIPHRIVRLCILCTVTIMLLWFHSWFPMQHGKTDIRTPMREINALQKPTDFYFATNPLVLFETQYYAADPSRVYFYNPTHATFPWYIGDSIVDPKIIKDTLPVYPQRAFLIREDGSYSIEYTLPFTQR